MRRTILTLLALGWLTASSVALAETAVITVRHLPPDEAASAARAVLSDKGTVTTLPSRRLLILRDDAAHIRQARTLLKRLDTPPAQLTAEVGFLESGEDTYAGFVVAGRLPGGWVRVQASADAGAIRQRKHLRLRITANRPAHLEAGTLRPVHRAVRELLHRHGWRDTPEFSLVPVTAGFDIEARLVDSRHAHVRIHPWFARTETATGAAGNVEILPDLGATDAPRTPPDKRAPIRLNLNPKTHARHERIRIAEATTELTVPLNRRVTLAAMNGAARTWGDALLGHGTSLGRRMLLMRFRISSARSPAR